MFPSNIYNGIETLGTFVNTQMYSLKNTVIISYYNWYDYYYPPQPMQTVFMMVELNSANPNEINFKCDELGNSVFLKK